MSERRFWKLAGMLLVTAVMLASGCVTESPPAIGSFEECVAAGHPVMESYPEQCNDGTRTWTNDACSSVSGEVLTMTDAISAAQASECAQEGTLATEGLTSILACNPGTGTVWIGMEPFEPKSGCNPACVVDVADRTAEVNWRCTGLVEPTEVK